MSDMSCYDRKAERQGELPVVGNPIPALPDRALILLRLDSCVAVEAGSETDGRS